MEKLLNNQEVFRNNIEVFGLDFTLLLMNFVKKRQGLPTLIDEQRKASIKANVERILEDLKLVQAELNA